ncbi:MAG: hypothetical protein V4787_11620 [Pseudomonadota bacterium]
MSYTVDTTATLWPFKPNWSSPLVETLEWNTSVVTSYNGDEQRTSLRPRARVTTDYQFLFQTRMAKRLDNLLWARQNRRLAIPQWQFVTPIDAEAAATADVIVLDTTLNGLVPGGWLLLMTDAETFEAAQIDEVGETNVTLVEPLVSTWPAGTKAYPLHFGYIESDVATRRETDRATTGAVRLVSDPATADPFIPVIAAPNTYNGYEILLTKPDWQGGIENAVAYDRDKADYGVGTFEYTRTATAPLIQRPFRWLHKSRAAVKDFRGFLGRRVGRQKAFYAPTWTDDLTLVSNISSVATTISCREELFGELVGLDPSRKHLYIRLRSGVTYLREITSVTPAGLAVTIGISSALGANVTIDAVQSIHFVPLWRLATDAIALQWYTPSTVVVDTPFALVKP